MQQMTRKEPAENAQLDVVALGELLVDFTAQAVDSWGFPVMAAHPGGAPANFLAAAANLAHLRRWWEKWGTMPSAGC